MIQVKKRITIGDFERWLNETAISEQEIAVPNTVTSDAVGGLASLIQLLITWSRQSPKTALVVYANGITDKSLAEFATTPFGLVGVNMAHVLRSVKGDAISRRDTLILAKPYVEAMHAGPLRALFKGGVIPIFCLDNAQYLKRPERLFRPGTEKIRDRTSLADLVRACLLAITPSGIPPVITRDYLDSAASLLYEALDNTQQHALTDSRGNLLTRSTRGMLIGYRYVDTARLSDMAGSSRPLKEYFSRLRLNRPMATNMQFLEMSVFDSGPGLAQTWLKKHSKILAELRHADVSLAEEYNAILKCLEKGNTGKYDSSTSGNGLYRIFRTLKYRSGFIKIRTNRLSLVRAFMPDDRENQIEQADLQMVDIETGNIPTGFRPWTYGTCMTIMLPINIEGSL